MIRAFTMIEVIMGVFLTSLLVYTSYEGYIFLDKMFHEKTAQDEKIQDYNLLHLIIKRDFFNSKAIQKYDDNTLECIYEDGTNAYYRFYESYVEKEWNGNVSHFHLDVKDFIFSFDGKLVEQNDELVNHLSFFFAGFGGSEINLSFYKLYGIDIEINKELDLLQ